MAHRRPSSFFGIAFSALAFGCGGAEQDGGSGGAGSGGAPSSGGSASAGGTAGSGGVAGSGGLPASGGAAASPPDAGADGDAGPAPCTITAADAVCRTREIVRIQSGGVARPVYWALPSGAPPAGGFPAVVLYQGSFFGPSLTWDVLIPRTVAFGGYFQVALVDALVRAGFVVVQPEAPGGIAWSTNMGGNYDTSADGVFIPLLLAEIGRGTFGRVDMARLYATGISSGGYMTSRMAVSHAGSFRALAIQSGSYATCVGPLCAVPATLPVDHPPTLFLHGGLDLTVPIATARPYEERLRSAGVDTKLVEDPAVGHAWLQASSSEILAWFQTH